MGKEAFVVNCTHCCTRTRVVMCISWVQTGIGTVVMMTALSRYFIHVRQRTTSLPWNALNSLMYFEFLSWVAKDTQWSVKMSVNQLYGIDQTAASEKIHNWTMNMHPTRYILIPPLPPFQMRWMMSDCLLRGSCWGQRMPTLRTSGTSLTFTWNLSGGYCLETLAESHHLLYVHVHVWQTLAESLTGQGKMVVAYCPINILLSLYICSTH